MQTRQSGFTLIELIIVIVILGALAAVAVPRFVDLQSDAEEASLDGIVGALASASSINFAGCSVSNPPHTPGANCVAVDGCTDLAGTLQQPLDNSKYTLGGDSDGTATAPGETLDCTVTPVNQSISTAVSFQALSAGI